MYMLHGHEIYDGKNAEDMETVKALYKIGTPLRRLDHSYVLSVLEGSRSKFVWYAVDTIDEVTDSNNYMYRVGRKYKIDYDGNAEEF